MGAATASAQVYSVNVVGYVNKELVPKFNLVANPLDNKAGNNVENLFGDTLPNGTGIYKWNCPPGSYEATNYYSTDFDPTGVWDDPAQVLAPGTGFWLNLAGTANKTTTFVGDVMQGMGADALVIPLCNGFNLVGSKVPQAGKLQADLGYVPSNGDAVYQWDATTQKYKPTSIYSTDFNPAGEWDPADPDIAVAEGFWLKTQAAGQWKREFKVS